MDFVFTSPGPSRIYAIGDIHGRLDLLDRLVGLIERDLAAAPTSDCLTVTLGDYMDRGPDSRGVLDRLAANPFSTNYIALKGNHELLTEGFLHDPASGDRWRRLGGLETLHSYGVDVRSLMIGKNHEETASAFRSALPKHHLAFLRSLKGAVSTDRYFLCHAGIRPGVPLERQREEDLLWIREPFLDSKSNFGKIVVHGHSPVEEPEVLFNRINIDTGAFMTGRLTCAVLETKGVRFLSTT